MGSVNDAMERGDMVFILRDGSEVRFKISYKEEKDAIAAVPGSTIVVAKESANAEFSHAMMVTGRSHRTLICQDSCGDAKPVHVPGDLFGVLDCLYVISVTRVSHRRKHEVPFEALDRSAVRHDDLVFIKVLDCDLWLSRNPRGTYCAVAGPETQRVPFRVQFVHFEGRPGIRLKYAKNHSYLGKNTCLYAATTGSTKYDVEAPNTKQLWVLDNKCNVDLMYNTPVEFMDRYTFSYMAVNTEASAAGYADEPGWTRNGRKWVEAKYDRDCTDKFRIRFMVVPAKGK